MKLDVPIISAIKEYIDSDPVPFHMPGHKMGAGLNNDYFGNIAAMDLTEIPHLDNLHNPDGVIEKSQKLAAQAFGAQDSFLIVNGSTCGVQAIIMTICRQGDKLIVSRDCHVSVINAMMLVGVEPIFISPGYDFEFGIPTAVSTEDVIQAVRANPEAKGVFLTRPNYYGVCCDIKSIAQIVHSYDMVLAVDEAHGAHLKFNSRLPVCAMESGADICVQSAHKTLPAMTQGSYLHVKSIKVDIDLLKSNLSVLQTTSPSYLILSTLDYARALMASEGERLLNNLLDYVEEFKENIKNTGCLQCDIKNVNNFQIDNTRLVINTKNKGFTGYEVERIIRQTDAIQVEMSDFNNIVCISTVSDKREYFVRLHQALARLENKVVDERKISDKYFVKFRLLKRVVQLKDINMHKTARINLENSYGRISKRVITPYPPGVPLVFPGEMIDEEVIDTVKQIIELGGRVNGIGPKNEVDVME